MRKVGRLVLTNKMIKGDTITVLGMVFTVVKTRQKLWKLAEQIKRYFNEHTYVNTTIHGHPKGVMIEFVFYG